MLSVLKETVYMVVGQEVILMDTSNHTIEILEQLRTEQKIIQLHLFLTQDDEKSISNVVSVIKYWNQKTKEKVQIYSPEHSICELFRLQGIPAEWYNFFINLWDELTFYSNEQMFEYTFYSEGKGWGVEVILPTQECLYYSNSSLACLIQRGYQPDCSYVRVKSILEYEELKRLTEVVKEQRKRIEVILDTDLINQATLKMDGFRISLKGK